MLIVIQLIKEFLTFYITWRFITGFTRAHHWTLCQPSYIHFTPSHTLFL